jgi:hypothetical protein
MIESIDFIRANRGRMSDTQIMRCLGLRRLSDYRELRAQAMVEGTRAEIEPSREERILARKRRPGHSPEHVAALLLRESGLPLQRIIAPANDFERVTRDLLAWLLRTHCRQAPAAIGRLLHMSEYSANLCLRRYNGAIECDSEQRCQRGWREKLARQLRRA